MIDYFKKKEDLIVSKSIKHLHLSIDIDCWDLLVAPGTGVPESKGLSIHEFNKIIQILIKTGCIAAIDLVELNRILDKNNATLLIFEKLITKIINGVLFNSDIKK
ncbi:arginase family protein [Bacteroides sp.]|uniref:arginase family protein n=1 Tax=Bacteroides sp. TaxID=29523 RepID=UPI0025893DEC|nr:arginase family protein [Bacteroides sp.]